MPLITVTATYLKLDSTPASGTVSFAPSTLVVNRSANEIVVPKTFTVALDASGSLSVSLPATDDPDFDPQGWTYLVTENVGVVRTYSIEVPVGTPGATLDLADVTPVPESPGVSYPIVDGGTP